MYQCYVYLVVAERNTKKFKLYALSDAQGVRAVFTINVHTGALKAKQKGAYVT